MSSSESAAPRTPSNVVEIGERLVRVESVARTQGARIAQLEDVLGIYGPPPKRGLNIPELTREQRNTVVVLIILAVVTAIPAVLMRMGHRDGA